MVVSARRSVRTSLMDVIRRSLIVVMVAVMGAGPSIPGKAVEVTSSLEVYYVIDRTGSMGAEDWDGGQSPHRRRAQRRRHPHELSHRVTLLDPVVGLERARWYAPDDRRLRGPVVHGHVHAGAIFLLRRARPPTAPPRSWPSC